MLFLKERETSFLVRFWFLNDEGGFLDPSQFFSIPFVWPVGAVFPCIAIQFISEAAETVIAVLEKHSRWSCKSGSTECISKAPTWLPWLRNRSHRGRWCWKLHATLFNYWERKDFFVVDHLFFSSFLVAVKISSQPHLLIFFFFVRISYWWLKQAWHKIIDNSKHSHSDFAICN